MTPGLEWLRIAWGIVTVIAKVDKINPLVKVLGATSGLMILVIAGWAVYIGLNSVQP
jgi:hypothetical protein